MANQVVVGVLHPDKVDGHFHDCFCQMLWHDRETSNQIAAVHSLQIGPQLSLGREQVARLFLKENHGVPWLLFLDADMTFTQNLIDALLSVASPAKTPVLGGLCFTADRHGGQIMPTMWTEQDDGSFANIVDYPESELVEVDQTGAACLLIHRSVFKRLDVGDAPLKFFGESVVNGRLNSEDRAFCARVREAGFPIHVHTGIELGHVKPQVIAESQFLASRSAGTPAA